VATVTGLQTARLSRLRLGEQKRLGTGNEAVGEAVDEAMIGQRVSIAGVQWHMGTELLLPPATAF